MFHMLSCFDLKAGITIEQFQTSNDRFLAQMQSMGLVQSAGSIGRRNRHPIMDTDQTRNQQYFYIMTFLDEDQCNRAVDRIFSHSEPDDAAHNEIIQIIENQTFICWEDI